MRIKVEKVQIKGGPPQSQVSSESSRLHGYDEVKPSPQRHKTTAETFEKDRANMNVSVHLGGAPRPISRGSHRRSRARRRRRISFSVDTVDSRSLASDPSRSRRIAHVCLATSVFATILLLWVLLVLWVSGYLDDYERSLTEGDGVETTARPTEPEDKTTTVEGDTDGREKKRREGGRRARDYATTESFTPLQHHDGTSLASHVCLYTHRDDVLYNYTPTASNETRSYHRRARHCDVLIRCCHVLENDMTLRVEASEPGSEKPFDFTKQCGGVHRRPSTTLAAVVEREWALRKLLSPGNHRARSDFVRDASRLARSEGYSGIRLWLPEAGALRMVKSSFVHNARWIATALRKANCTLGYFLPYPAAHPAPEWYATRLRILANVLKSSQSILLYPTTSVFRKRSRWPSPAKMAVVENVAVIPARRSVCYLLLSAAAVSVVSQSCDVSKAQRVSVSRAFLTSRELHELCRSRNSSSQKLSSHRYHSYLCGLAEAASSFRPHSRRGGSARTFLTSPSHHASDSLTASVDSRTPAIMFLRPFLDSTCDVSFVVALPTVVVGLVSAGSVVVSESSHTATIVKLKRRQQIQRRTIFTGPLVCDVSFVVALPTVVVGLVSAGSVVVSESSHTATIVKLKRRQQIQRRTIFTGPLVVNS
ncbi:hypothetical protein HPB50_011358 [Hyalomma asiaticum]|uniref:Uncharacterized protein n=1 Tax=Hyalomma asiaticum TaxID=266040 RepID=A0ACB7SX85_HYAAI|nr:hypothetical protein HPB50_011358 [Hyalomma asiaticum]